MGVAAAFYLAAAVWGTLGLMDEDAVELSNLPAPAFLHSTANMGGARWIGGRETGSAESHVEVLPLAERISSANASVSWAGYDFVIDATDNFSPSS